MATDLRNSAMRFDIRPRNFHLHHRRMLGPEIQNNGFTRVKNKKIDPNFNPSKQEIIFIIHLNTFNVKFTGKSVLNRLKKNPSIGLKLY